MVTTEPPAIAAFSSSGGSRPRPPGVAEAICSARAISGVRPGTFWKSIAPPAPVPPAMMEPIGMPAPASRGSGAGGGSGAPSPLLAAASMPKRGAGAPAEGSTVVAPFIVWNGAKPGAAEERTDAVPEVIPTRPPTVDAGSFPRMPDVCCAWYNCCSCC